MICADRMFYFWYRFIPKCRFQIAMGLKEEAYEKKVLPFLPDYFGIVFEDICRQYILRQTANRKFKEVYDDYGKWWGPNPNTKEQEEIDFAAVSKDKIITGVRYDGSLGGKTWEKCSLRTWLNNAFKVK